LSPFCPMRANANVHSATKEKTAILMETVFTL
jgi:hypothetical protein